MRKRVRCDMKKEYVWYDLEKLWKKTSVSRKKFEKLKKEIKEEFPNDEMMYELHVMRALNALGT